VDRVLFVFPTQWDSRQLAACRESWGDTVEIDFSEPSHEDCPWTFDVLSFIEETARSARGRIKGVASSSDYPGATAAAAIAEKLGLPGPRPQLVIRASHKYASRLAQREAVPEATPRFHLIDSTEPERSLSRLTFPCFVKPVKGAFSVMARQIDTAEDLLTFMKRPAMNEFTNLHMRMFNRLVPVLTDLDIDGRFFIAEQLIGGRQATVEGFVHEQRVEVLGVVDSILKDGSFVRFDYPSSLPVDIQARMGVITRRAITRLGLNSTMFNVEMAWDPSSGAVRIIEVNPRMCGQYADLYQKVDGINGYEVALSLATGRRPGVRCGEGPFNCASSVPLRVYEPVRVVSVPDDDTVAAVERDLPGTMVWQECRPGQELSDFESIEDGRSCRYAVVNVGASNPEEIENNLGRVLERLDFRFERL
jgi:biotin carboxylase